MITKYELNNFQDFGPPAISADRLNKMDIAIKEAIENRVSKSIEKEFTLNKNQWVVDEKGQVKYILNIPEVTNTTTQMIYPALGLSLSELRTLQKADIQDGGQSAGQIILCAYGIKPTENTKIRVLIQEAIYVPTTTYEDVSKVEF